MDRRLAEYQIRVIEIAYHAHEGRGELGTFRRRAYEILGGLGRDVGGDTDLLGEIIRRVRQVISGVLGPSTAEAEAPGEGLHNGPAAP